MEVLSPSEHKSRLTNLAALWREAAAKARSLEQEAAIAFAVAKQEAERALLLVSHDATTGLVQVFHLVEAEPKEAPKPN